MSAHPLPAHAYVAMAREANRSLVYYLRHDCAEMAARAARRRDRHMANARRADGLAKLSAELAKLRETADSIAATVASIAATVAMLPSITSRDQPQPQAAEHSTGPEAPPQQRSGLARYREGVNRFVRTQNAATQALSTLTGTPPQTPPDRGASEAGHGGQP